MKRAISWIWDNILFLETLFLLAFIPLFPKIPILDVKNTWVYIRAEDFIVVFILFSWIILLVKEKITLKTPITIPILIFWIVGAVATIHGVLLIFPEIANVHPNVAFLSLLRHIEYMSVFFIAFAGIRDKRQLKIVIATLIITLLGVILYGFGQKYFGFPAFLTMNEEFAKGIPIQLSQLSRVPSTFAGHYDLAAYLVLIIPLLISLSFGFKNWLVKIGLFGISGLGFILLFMTVSRVSFFVLFAALLVVFFFQKKKLLLLSIPLIAVLIMGLLTFQSSLFDRFKSTVSEVDVVVDAKTGESLGHVKFVPKEYFADKIVLQRRVRDKEDLDLAIVELEQNSAYYSSRSAILPFKFIPPEVPLVTAVNVSTGESLGQGTGYINLYLSPVVKRIGNFYLELPSDFKSSPSAQILVFHGDFIVKRAAAYDLSFTTRFQGEWPNAVEAFKRNVLVGSGYGSVSLAVDNNYLRILAEIGLLGFVSFFLIFLSLGIYIKKVFPDIDSNLARSFIIGFGAGLVGLALNATLIDVFEASKIAFLLWILIGVTFGILTLYQKRTFSLFNEIKKIATSSYAIFAYLFIFCFVLFSPTLNNYFVGDDFTWFRWAADCRENCNPVSIISNYFTNSDGFFYRPGTKIYFYVMHNIFGLNQVIYHLVSILLHFSVAALFYLLAKKVLKSNLLGALSAFLFLIMSGSVEAVLWISAVGHLFATVFGLLGVLCFIWWNEKKKIYLYIASFISFTLALLFYEIAVIFPLLIVAYLLFKDLSFSTVKRLTRRVDLLALSVPIVGYLAIRYLSASHWFNGDYSYDLVRLPFNFVGNILGYILISVLGPISFPLYSALRNIARDNIFIMLALVPVGISIGYLFYKFVFKNLEIDKKKIIIFGSALFVILLLPFLGLGNITSRYSYMATLGLILIFIVVIREIYGYLLKNGEQIALGFVSIVLVVFALFHIIQVQQTYSQWREAGSKISRFFISFDGLYNSNWSNSRAEFHFVNVPIKFGDAWVFPVGLNDAVWFAFRNENAKVFIHADTKSALEQAGYDPFKIVLEFKNDGSVKEINRSRSIPTDLIKP